MRPRGGFIFISVGFFTLFQAIVSTFFAAFGCAVFKCYAKFPMAVDAKHRLNYLLYLTYFKGRCDVHPGGAKEWNWCEETDAARRTFYFLLIYGVVNSIWMATSALLLIAGVRRLRGTVDGAKLCYPWVINTAILIILDVIGGIWYGIDITQTLTSPDFREFVGKEAGPLPVQLSDVTFLPSVVLTSIFLRGVILLVLNVVICAVVVQAVGAINTALKHLHDLTAIEPVEERGGGTSGSMIHPMLSYRKYSLEISDDWRATDVSKSPIRHGPSRQQQHVSLRHHGSPKHRHPGSPVVRHQGAARMESFSANVREPDMKDVSSGQKTNRTQEVHNSPQEIDQELGSGSAWDGADILLQDRLRQQAISREQALSQLRKDYFANRPASFGLPRPKLTTVTESGGSKTASMRPSSSPLIVSALADDQKNNNSPTSVEDVHNSPQQINQELGSDSAWDGADILLQDRLRQQAISREQALSQLRKDYFANRPASFGLPRPKLTTVTESGGSKTASMRPSSSPLIASALADDQNNNSPISVENRETECFGNGTDVCHSLDKCKSGGSKTEHNLHRCDNVVDMLSYEKMLLQRYGCQLQRNNGGPRTARPEDLSSHPIMSSMNSRDLDPGYIHKEDRRKAQLWVWVNGKLRPHDYHPNCLEKEQSDNAEMAVVHAACSEQAKITQQQLQQRQQELPNKARKRPNVAGQEKPYYGIVVEELVQKLKRRNTWNVGCASGGPSCKGDRSSCRAQCRESRKRKLARTNSPTHDSIPKHAEHLRIQYMQDRAKGRARHSCSPSNLKNHILKKPLIKKLKDAQQEKPRQTGKCSVNANPDTPLPDYTPPGSPRLGMRSNGWGTSENSPITVITARTGSRSTTESDSSIVSSIRADSPKTSPNSSKSLWCSPGMFRFRFSNGVPPSLFAIPKIQGISSENEIILSSDASTASESIYTTASDSTPARSAFRHYTPTSKRCIPPHFSHTPSDSDQPSRASTQENLTTYQTPGIIEHLAITNNRDMSQSDQNENPDIEAVPIEKNPTTPKNNIQPDFGDDCPTTSSEALSIATSVI